MKRDRVQSALQALARAARRPHEPATLVLLRNALADRSNHVVGRAARAAREADLASLAPDLVAAFPRFLEDPIRCDPGCVAKREIVHALLAFSWPAPDVFLPGIVHVQREPAFGEPIDTAPELRALSAMALVVTGHPTALGACVGMLVDPEAAVPFVVERLAASDDDVARAAALALGEARCPDAVAALRERLRGEERQDVRHAILLALATSRDDAAFETLLELVARGSAADSKAAVEALRIYEHDAALQERVQAALEGRSPVRRRTRRGR